MHDISLLISAYADPEATYEGEYLHKDLYDMAAAYAFNICMNHPFIDGNKRTALVSALIFLDINGIDIEDPKGLLYTAMMNVAEGKKKKDYLATIFKKLTKR